MKNPKNIAFFGTPPLTTRFLDALYDEGYVPACIVTNPDRPVGRGMVYTAPEPKRWGEQYGIPVLQPEILGDEFYETLSKTPWDLFVVVAYGKIIPERIINLPKCGTINVHYSLLPRYRGATPVESAILHGDSNTGVCIQQMRYKLDTGPILTQQTVTIAPTDTTVTLREKLNDEAVRLVPEVLQSIFDHTATPIEQDDAKATYCKKIAKEDGLITLADDPIILDRKFRAYQPWPGLFFMHEKNGTTVRVKIKEAHLADGAFVIDAIIPENGKPLHGAAVSQWLNASL